MMIDIYEIIDYDIDVRHESHDEYPIEVYIFYIFIILPIIVSIWAVVYEIPMN